MNSNLTLSICCKNQFYRFSAPFLIGSSVRYKLKRLPRSEFYIRPSGAEPDKKVAENLATGQLKHRKHPGLLSIGAVEQPRKFERSLIKSAGDLDLKTLKLEAKKLYEQLFHRQMPWTEKMFERKFDQMLSNRIEKVVENYKMQIRETLGASPTDQEVYEFVESQSEKLNKQVSSDLKKSVYNWKSSDYKSKARCLAYALARFAPDYAILKKIFNEIKRREPHFAPSHVFDFGSGVGSTIWAVENTWPAKDTRKNEPEKLRKNSHVTLKNEGNDDSRTLSDPTDPSGHVTDQTDHVICQESTNGELRRQYFCIDTSPDMINLANELLRDGQSNGPMIFDRADVYFRQFLPALQENQYDLTVSAFSMMEIPAYEERMRIAVNLWNKTKEFLVFVENGNRYGYTLLMEIRDYLLAGGKEIWRKELRNLLESKNLDWQMAKEICARKDLTEKEKMDELRRNFGAIQIPTMFPAGHVFAPCPHDYLCPRLKDVLPCKFSQSYYDLRLVDDDPALHKLKYEPFIYLILRKGSRDQFEYPSADWPRLVKPVLIRHNHVLCEMCTANGILSEMTATKNKHGRDVYKMIKNSEFGDLLPVKLTFHPKKKNEENEALINEQLLGVENLVKNSQNSDSGVAGDLPDDENDLNSDDFFDGFDDVIEDFEENSDEEKLAENSEK